MKHLKNDRNLAMYHHMCLLHDLSGITDQSVRMIKETISRFASKLLENWESSRRIKDRFLASNAEWLEGEDIHFYVSQDMVEASTYSQLPPGVGTPLVDLTNASAKNKKTTR